MGSGWLGSREAIQPPSPRERSWLSHLGSLLGEGFLVVERVWGLASYTWWPFQGVGVGARLQCLRGGRDRVASLAQRASQRTEAVPRQGVAPPRPHRKGPGEPGLGLRVWFVCWWL